MKKSIIIFGAVLSASISYGQWSNQGGPFARWGNGSSANALNTWRSYGFGNFAGNGATPQARMHLNEFYLFSPWTGVNGNLFRTDGNSANINQWEFYTGVDQFSLTRKYRVFTTLNSGAANGTLQNDQNIVIEASQRDMIFNAGGNNERMRILGQNHNLAGVSPWFATARAGNVGIETPHPLTLLHMGGEGAAGAGWRPWMDIGTYYASRGGFDNMYIGLRNIAGDQNEAIINWGNNPSTAPFNADRLRFVFTAAPGNGIASGVNGLEIARMWANNTGDGRMGIGDFFTSATDPQNTLEIMASPASPYWANAAGTSGLRMTFMSSNNTPMANPGTGVLSVDANGDVIYVNGGTGGYALCSDPPTLTDLTDNGKMGLNDFNFYFEGQGATNNKVGVGYSCASGMLGKLSVTENSGLGIGVFAYVNSSGNNFGGLFRVDSGSNNTAVQGNAAGGTTAAGGRFTGFGGTTASYGIYSIASGGTTNIAVYGASTGSQSIGVYGEALPASGNNPPSGPNYAGYFNGDVVRTGTDNFTSDANFKTNINSIVDASSIIEQLNPVSFEFDQVNHPEMVLSSGLNYGFLAQDVEQILPELVSDNVHPAKYDTLGNVVYNQVNYKALNYQAFISILTKGMQEQQSDIQTLNTENDSLQALVTDLNDRLTQLENCLSNILPALCQTNAMMIENTPEAVQEELRSIIDVNLNDQNNIVLNQNVPNPFAERTVITYMIPETVSKAQIHFYDGMGKLINSVEITERGNGQLNVYANDLSNGVYTYSLIADGQVVATKRMVKQ